ncbi:MAG: hypothetical protein ACO1RX_02460 [Candidatus Sericytochromatia bacterium]
MRKAILGLCLVFSLTPPLWAATQPSDQVGIINIVEKNGIESSNKRYYKAWKDIKLDAKTKAALVAKTKQLDADYQKYRLGFLFIMNDKVTRVLFYGDHGGIVMMDWPTGSSCQLTFDGNGGFAGFGNPCTEP